MNNILKSNYIYHSNILQLDIKWIYVERNQDAILEEKANALIFRINEQGENISIHEERPQISIEDKEIKENSISKDS